MFKDYYKILGISSTSDQQTIKTNFRKLAFMYHPDLNTSSQAKHKFQEIQEAYEVLNNHETRAKYDILHTQFKQKGFVTKRAPVVRQQTAKERRKEQLLKKAKEKHRKREKAKKQEIERAFVFSLVVFFFTLSIFFDYISPGTKITEPITNRYNAALNPMSDKIITPHSHFLIPNYKSAFIIREGAPVELEISYTFKIVKRARIAYRNGELIFHPYFHYTNLVVYILFVVHFFSLFALFSRKNYDTILGLSIAQGLFLFIALIILF